MAPHLQVHHQPWNPHHLPLDPQCPMPHPRPWRQMVSLNIIVVLFLFATSEFCVLFWHPNQEKLTEYYSLILCFSISTYILSSYAAFWVSLKGAISLVWMLQTDSNLFWKCLCQLSWTKKGFWFAVKQHDLSPQWIYWYRLTAHGQIALCFRSSLPDGNVRSQKGQVHSAKNGSTNILWVCVDCKSRTPPEIPKSNYYFVL